MVEEFKDKRMLLTKSVKMRENDSETWRNVFITPDQTYKQRQENNLVIRYGIIQCIQKQDANQGSKAAIVSEQPVCGVECTNGTVFNASTEYSVFNNDLVLPDGTFTNDVRGKKEDGNI